MTPNNDETRKPEGDSASPEAATEAPESEPTAETAETTETADSTAPKTEDQPSAEPEAPAAASPESEKETSPAEAEAASEPVTESEPTGEAEPEPATEPVTESEPTGEAEPEPATEPVTESERTSEAEPEPASESVTEPEPASETEPGEPSTEVPVAEMAAAPESEATPAASSEQAEAETVAEATDGATEGGSEEEAGDPKIAEELTKAAAAVGPTLKAGKRLKVTLVQVGEKDSFVDFGGRSEGSIATSELKNEKGELKHNVGDEIGVVVRKGGDSPVFTMGRRRVPANLGKVKEAFENKVPIEGKVKSTNKGGFEIDLGGVRAFCPYSQIQLGYCDKPEDYVGQKMPFTIITFERGGRNIVVSRRKLLEEESKAAAGETMEKLELGAVFEGVVRRLQPYGAFVDIGGMDGLVHVSEISHGRVSNPSDVLEVGEQVKVKVIRLEGEGDKRRISLSMKELAGDPWEEVPEKYQEGATIEGRVVRLAEFGAFVELETGVDGLVHISEISTERIQHPSDKLQKGQTVEVRVLQVDPEQRRISLSLLSEEESEQARSQRAPRRGGGRSRRDDGLMHHRSETPVEGDESDEDVTKMPFEDALQALKNKFKGD